MNIKHIINKQDIIIVKVETLINIVKLFNIIKLLSIKVSWVILETKLLKFISFTVWLDWYESAWIPHNLNVFDRFYIVFEL